MVIDITTPDGVETVRIQGDPFLDALDQEILRLGGLTNAFLVPSPVRMPNPAGRSEPLHTLESLKLDKPPMETLGREPMNYMEDAKPDPTESGSGVTPPDRPKDIQIEKASRAMETGQRSPRPVQPPSGDVSPTLPSCLSLQVVDVSNEEPSFHTLERGPDIHSSSTVLSGRQPTPPDAHRSAYPSSGASSVTFTPGSLQNRSARVASVSSSNRQGALPFTTS